MADADSDSDLLESAKRHAEAVWRPRARRAVAAGVGFLGRRGVPRMARGVRSNAPLDHLDNELGGTADFSASYVVDDDAPPLCLAYSSSGPLQHRPVATYHLVVDTHDPRYSFNGNVMLDHEHYVITEDMVTWDSLTLSRSLLQEPRRLEGTVAYLSNTWVDNYAHWLFMAFPLIDVYRRRLGVEPDRYYVGEPLRPFHVETLARAGIDRSRIVTGPARADRLVADIANRRWSRIDPDFFAYSRSVMREGRPDAAPTRRLYVGRGDVAHRHFRNERDCVNVLTDEYGFETVTMDGLSVADQVELFESAECVVAVHGAALANLLWASPKVKVLELMPYGREDPMFADLSATFGYEYAVVTGVDVYGDRTVASLERNLQRRLDLVLDVDEMREALSALRL